MTEPKGLPLSAFDPRLKQALLAGCLQEVKLRTSNRRQAVRLRHRLNSFRAQARRENLLDSEQLYGCVVSIEEVPAADRRFEKEWFVVLRPRDRNLSDLLDQVAPHPLAQSANTSLPADPLDDLEPQK